MKWQPPKSIYTESVVTAIVCAVVGLLAARGTFNSVMNFPVIFTAIVVGFAGLSLRRERPRQKTVVRAAILAVGAVLAVAGWSHQGRVIERSQIDARLLILEEIQGSTAPSLADLEPLNTDQESWETAAAFRYPATIITFWARWCSPCWKEMEELEQLHRQLQGQGLRVVAITRYDTPEDDDARSSDFAKATDFLEKRGITYPSAITDRDDVYGAFRVASPPGAVLIDGRGQVVDFAISLESVRVLMEKASAMVAAAEPAAVARAVSVAREYGVLFGPLR